MYQPTLPARPPSTSLVSLSRCGGYPYRLCHLKRQPTGAGGRPNLASYGSGPAVPWTAGHLSPSSGGGGQAGSVQLLP